MPPSARLLPKKTDVAIIGAGFAGIAAGHSLQQAGVTDFVMVERDSEIGGVWRDNTYPGCSCDIPSRLYSFSFAPQPEWTDRFASQREILHYVQNCAASLGLNEHIYTDTNVVDLSWSNETARWLINTSSGELVARMVVMAAGVLNEPKFPKIAGRDEFAGEQFHSSQWPADFDATGKRIALIGTGSSAIQIGPAIAPDAKSLTVFQRTPTWVVPRGDRAIPDWSKKLYRAAPRTERASRWIQYATREWMAGSFVGSGKFMNMIERVANKHRDRQVSDSALRSALTPNYRAGCKRIVSSDDWYPMFNRDHVTLEVAPIEHMTRNGIVVNGDEHEFDVVMYATGFKIDRLPMPFVVTGASGISLAHKWGMDRASAYLGTTVPDFPNFGVMTGPNTGLGNSSMLLMIEAQARYLAQMAQFVTAHDTLSMDVRVDVFDDYTADIERRLQRSVWATGGCTSWYQDPAGRVTALWPGTTAQFARRTRKLDLTDYYVRSL